MNNQEFETLLVDGRVDRITINRMSADNVAWEIIVHGSSLPPTLKNVIELNGNGGQRSWTDLDAAYIFIRKSGYRHAIEITDPVA